MVFGGAHHFFDRATESPPEEMIRASPLTPPLVRFPGGCHCRGLLLLCHLLSNGLDGLGVGRHGHVSDRLRTSFGEPSRVGTMSRNVAKSTHANWPSRSSQQCCSSLSMMDWQTTVLCICSTVLRKPLRIMSAYLSTCRVLQSCCGSQVQRGRHRSARRLRRSCFG